MLPLIFVICQLLFQKIKLIQKPVLQWHELKSEVNFSDLTQI